MILEYGGNNGCGDGETDCGQMPVVGEPETVEHQQPDHPDYSQFSIDNIN